MPPSPKSAIAQHPASPVRPGGSRRCRVTANTIAIRPESSEAKPNSRLPGWSRASSSLTRLFTALRVLGLNPCSRNAQSKTAAAIPLTVGSTTFARAATGGAGAAALAIPPR